MTGSDLDLGGGLKATHLLKKGYTGYFEGREFHIFRGSTLVESFSDSQGKILTQLRQKNALTPTQLSEAVDMTPAAVIYNLKHLVKAGVVEKHPLPGGTVFYILSWDVEVDLSPALRARMEPVVSSMGGWSDLAKVPMGRLQEEMKGFSEDEFLEVMRFLVARKNHDS